MNSVTFYPAADAATNFQAKSTRSDSRDMLRQQLERMRSLNSLLKLHTHKVSAKSKDFEQYSRKRNAEN